MAVQSLHLHWPNLSAPLTKSSYRVRSLPRAVTSLPFLCLSVLCILATVHAQTFQYSRGWTNGKRSGPTGSSAVGLVDLESGYISPDITEFGVLPGHIQMSLSPQARLRTLDYNQYLARKLGVGSTGNLNTRKQPLWFGTIMGMDSSDSPASSSQAASGSASNSPSGSSNDF